MYILGLFKDFTFLRVKNSKNFTSNLKKKVPNHYLDHYPSKEMMLRLGNGTFLWRLEPKLKPL